MIDIDYPDPIVKTLILFLQTTRGVLKYIDAHTYREAHISSVQLIVLYTLSCNQGIMTHSELADWTQTERHNITTLVQRMKKDGLITVERSNRDRRVVNVILTDKGKQTLDQARPVAADVVNQAMSTITESDAAILEKLLRVLRQNAQSGLERLSRST